MHECCRQQAALKPSVQLKKSPDVIEKFVKATPLSIQYMKEHRGKTVAVLMDFTKVDTELAELTYDDMVLAMADDGAINVKGVEAMQAYFRSVGPQTGAPPHPVNISMADLLGEPLDDRALISTHRGGWEWREHDARAWKA